MTNLQTLYKNLERQDSLEFLIVIDEDAGRTPLAGNFLVNAIRSQRERATLVEGEQGGMDKYAARLETQKPYDAVFIDPAISTNFVKGIKDLYPETPIYAMSNGYKGSDQISKDKLQELGLNGIINPFDPEQVRFIISEISTPKRSTEDTSTDQEVTEDTSSPQTSPTP